VFLLNEILISDKAKQSNNKQESFLQPFYIEASIFKWGLFLV